MTAMAALLKSGLGPGKPMRVLAASGQLGYGIPEAAFRKGLAQNPHIIGCDMGSIDVGPYYLGSGNLATAPSITKRDLQLVLLSALDARIPLVIGTAGTAGAKPHLEQTLAMIRTIARENGRSFRLAWIPADIPRDLLKSMIAAGRTQPIATMPALTEIDVERAKHIVGQMGVEAFIRAMEMEPDVIVTGRACDTAVFAAAPIMLGYPIAASVHMAKIIECTSICCIPGGRDAMLGTLDGDSFTLESMNPARAATPLSVAAHSLYEQADPLSVYEPEGMLNVGEAKFEAIDERRTRVSGATWHPAEQYTVKIEASEWVGERAILCAGSCDPRVIANSAEIVSEVRKIVNEIVPPTGDGTYDLFFRIYGENAVSLFPTQPKGDAAEVFFLVECIASTAELARSVISVSKQYLLHHGFAGRLSTGGNIAFPFTPPELPAGAAYRFSAYHIMDCDSLPDLFPVHIETVTSDSAA
ncbi:acyclic terpene utilization AtuA family protein [Microvirga antarctica]|uniref:acyclic terpene utilization AtuA family protein n=1 Tax=Microvirga antarctica TaxID=2819233 RepID=UPI001B315520|nr:acyclic terpene utilization AtuA family protein [Microvirga antarctica]